MFSASFPDTASTTAEQSPEFATEVRLRQLLAASRRLIDAVVSAQPEQALLQLGVELAADLVGARYGAIGIMDGKEGYRHFLHTGITPDTAEMIGPAPRGHGVLGRIIDQREPLRINNLPMAARSGGFPPHHPHMQTLLALPIYSLGRPYGRIYLCNRRDGAPFTAQDELILSHFVQYLTLALERASEREANADGTPRSGGDVQRLRRLLDMSPGALLVIQDAVIVAANVHALPVLGAQTLGELVGKPVAKLVHPDSHAMMAARLAEGTTTARLPRVEYRLRRLDGADGWIEEHSARIGYLGRPAALALVKDITAEKRAATQLAALHALAEQLNRAETSEAVYQAGLTALRATAEADKVAILLVDKTMRMRVAAWDGLSEACRAVADGYSPWPPDDSDLQPVFITDPQAVPDLAGCAQVLAGEGVTSLAFIPVVHHRRLIGALMLCFERRHDFTEECPRHALWIAEHVGIGLSRQQMADRAFRTSHQLNARVRHRTQQLEEAIGELEAFSYSVSHDLRGPLRAMNGFATILLGEHAEKLDATAQSYLQRIVTASRHMERLIDDLLRLSRVNRFEIQPTRVDLSALAREIVAKLTDSDPARVVDWDIEQGMIVDADPGLMPILLENLIENAWKYTSRKDPAQIRFRRRQIDGREVFEVSDNGAGFDMQYAEKLFAPFQRLHSASEFSGTGIGLAIVQRILRRHGGNVAARSERDKGTTIEFSFWDNATPEELSQATPIADLQQ